MKISLKAARVNAGLTLVKAAQATDIDKNTLSKYENGVTSPTIETVLKLCTLYGAALDDIFLNYKSA